RKTPRILLRKMFPQTRPEIIRHPDVQRRVVDIRNDIHKRIPHPLNLHKKFSSMLTFVNLSGGNAYDGYIIPKILGHNGASTHRTVLTQGQLLQHLRAGANEGAFANLHVTGDITAGHDDGKASEFYVVADGGEKVNDGELAGDYAGSENATRGDDATATKI